MCVRVVSVFVVLCDSKKKKDSKQGLNYVMDVPCATAAWASASRHVRQAAGRIAWT